MEEESLIVDKWWQDLVSFYIVHSKYPRFLILSWEKEYLQTKRLLNATSHFLISHIVGHLLEFIKISLGPPILKIDNFT